jgi:hypothetical protein
MSETTERHVHGYHAEVAAREKTRELLAAVHRFAKTS